MCMCICVYMCVVYVYVYVCVCVYVCVYVCVHCGIISLTSFESVPQQIGGVLPKVNMVL